MESKYTILVVDDNTQNLKVLAHLMEESGYNVVLADSGEVAFEYLETEIPHLILLDVMMPEQDGYEVITALKKNEKYAQIPVMFITAKSETQDVVKGFELGAVDYVCKPFNWIELRARVKTHIHLNTYRGQLSTLNCELVKANEELVATNKIINTKNEELKTLLEELDALSKTDYLTGLFNRRHIVEKINAEISRCKRTRKPFAVLLGDIDFFKKVNDTCGHDGGDEVLKGIAKIFREVIREVDSASRWGGEEFLILALEITPDDALALGERLRHAVEKTPIIYNGTEVRVTITIGVSMYEGHNESSQDVIMRSDKALYIGKRNGRNRVAVLQSGEF